MRGIHMTLMLRRGDGWDFEGSGSDASGSTGETQMTLEAHSWARGLARDQFGRRTDAPGWSSRTRDSRLRILTPHGYVAEVRGQSSATAHGKQGAHPAQIAEARGLDLPVLMVFKDGGVIWSLWLDDPAPDVINIDHDPAHRRQGWWCKQMKKGKADDWRFPEDVPTFEPGGLF